MFKKWCCNKIQKLRQDFLLLFLYALVIILIIFIILALRFNNINESSPTLIKVIFSSETLVAIVAGIAGIYSWRHSKSKIEYEKKLQMLKDIDVIREFYIDREDELEIIKQCQSHIKKMKDETKNSSNEFLSTYLDYVSSKFENNDSPMEYGVDDSNHHIIESKNQDENKGSNRLISLPGIKGMIAEKEKTDAMYVRYSKNYKGSSIDSVVIWKTWYTLRKNMLDRIKNDDKVIFFTKVGSSYQGCEIVGEKLKKLIKEVPVRNSKDGNLQYDFYISKNDTISCESENGENIDLLDSDYGVKELNLTYLNEET